MKHPLPELATKDQPTQRVKPELRRFAEELADAARPISLRYFRTPLDIEQKKDSSPVTIADRQVKTTMRDIIAARHPLHGIYGEEHGNANPGQPHVWILDPIDGTKSFITGMPTFGTLIAFLDHGIPQIGVVDMPALDERWVGVSGSTTTMNGTACQTRQCRRLGDANLYTTSLDLFDSAELAAFNAVSAKAAMRRFGGDCYSYALLASGYIDAVIETSLHPYDHLPLVPIIEGAGGVITDWTGAPLKVASDGRVIAAATPELHTEIITIVAACYRE